MIPELKEIKGFSGYYVSSCGRVFSTKKRVQITEMVLKEDKDGYLEAGLYANGKRYWRRVHRLVATMYIENPNNYPQVNHIDGYRSNNNVANLEWVTCQENVIHSFRTLNRIQQPTTNKRIVLIERETGEELTFNSIKDVSRFLRMSHEHFGRLASGKLDISKCKKLKPYIVKFL